MNPTPRCLIFALLLGLSVSAAAQDTPVPYWASLRVNEINMRVGPGEDYRIAWVYRRKELPVKVLRLKEGWRLVQDPDGARGWMLGRFLSRERSALVRGEGLAEMREKAAIDSRLMWRLEPGVVVRLGECTDSWCQVEVEKRTGFVRQDRLWGAGEP